MADYTSNLTLADAAARLRGAARIFAATHAKPDGDAFGSVVALAAALRQLGKPVTAWFAPPVPGCFSALRGADLTTVSERVELTGPPSAAPGPWPLALGPDLVVILDTGAWAQLGSLKDALPPHLSRTLILDHHLSGDIPAAWRYIDGKAAACCEIVAELLDEVQRQETSARGVPVDLHTPAVCDALYVGIASDTGWFRFSNTRPQTLELAARLLRRGVDHADLYRQLEQAERPEKLALMIRALDSMRLLAHGRVAVMVLRGRDFVETGAGIEETERFVDVPQMVSTVQVVVMVTETPVGPAVQAGTACNPAPSPSGTAASGPPLIRLSFRSKPGPNAVNVADLARTFGGGGHARAAGAKLTGRLEDVVEQVSAALTAALG